MDFTAPSFSLGFDFDDPPSPVGGSCQEEQARRYEAPDAPSFSLGIEDEFYDGDGGKEPSPTARRPQEEQARRYEAPDAPSFSLGIDDDDDGANEPYFPSGSCLDEQDRRYEAPDAPSFSLGIDDDDEFVASGQRHEQSRPQVPLAPPSSHGIDDEDDDFVLAGSQRPARARDETLDPDPLPLPRFKRLRRGPALPPLEPTPPPPRAPGSVTMEASPMLSGKAALGAVGSFEDEIEDFTDEERPVPDLTPSVGSCSTSSNSKFSLLNHGVLMSQSISKAKIPKFTQFSNSFTSKSLEESCTKKLLPKITISPLRKIHSLDSDTDSEENKNRSKEKKPVGPIKRRQESMNKFVQKKPSLQQNSKSEGSSVAQKSEPKVNDSWVTPALDEFCNEYFKSVKDSRQSQQKEVNISSGYKVSQSNDSVGEIRGYVQRQCTSSGVVLEENLTDSHPPAMHYFFHHDLMVQKLVRERLQHFLPIGTSSMRQHAQSAPENLNYGSQFNLSGAADDRWVTPNGRTSVPTDVGKRRVHATGTHSGSGHWFTGDDGRKVYVSKNGQELTGRDAYRQYKKESSGGFQKWKKKKGAVKKEGSAGVKRGSSRAKKTTSTAKRKR